METNRYITDRTKQFFYLADERIDAGSREILKKKFRSMPYINELSHFLEEWFDDSPYLVVNTSGSTGKPKPISVNKEMMMHSALNTCRTLGLSAGDTALLCMPLDYIAGKMMVVRALVASLKLVICQPDGHPLANITETDRHCHYRRRSHRRTDGDPAAQLPESHLLHLRHDRNTLPHRFTEDKRGKGISFLPSVPFGAALPFGRGDTRYRCAGRLREKVIHQRPCRTASGRQFYYYRTERQHHQQRRYQAANRKTGRGNTDISHYPVCRDGCARPEVWRKGCPPVGKE